MDWSMQNIWNLCIYTTVTSWMYKLADSMTCTVCLEIHAALPILSMETGHVDNCRVFYFFPSMAWLTEATYTEILAEIYALRTLMWIQNNGSSRKRPLHPPPTPAPVHQSRILVTRDVVLTATSVQCWHRTEGVIGSPGKINLIGPWKMQNDLNIKHAWSARSCWEKLQGCKDLFKTSRQY